MGLLEGMEGLGGHGLYEYLMTEARRTFGFGYSGFFCFCNQRRLTDGRFDWLDIDLILYSVGEVYSSDLASKLGRYMFCTK